jgi:hypothetical protein
MVALMIEYQFLELFCVDELDKGAKDELESVNYHGLYQGAKRWWGA